VLEEILVTELLTRVWAAVAAACDSARGRQELDPIAQNVFRSHLDARRRLLAIVAEARAIALPHAVLLNELRRRVERWTDMLLAHVAPFIDVTPFAPEPARARDFAEDLDHQSTQSDSRLTGEIILASLRASFTDGLENRSPNSDLNRRIASALLGMLPASTDDPASLAKSLWLQRLFTTANEAEGMVEELLRLEMNPLLPNLS